MKLTEASQEDFINYKFVFSFAPIFIFHGEGFFVVVACIFYIMQLSETPYENEDKYFVIVFCKANKASFYRSNDRLFGNSYSILFYYGQSVPQVRDFYILYCRQLK